jgi:hypothetical protein
LLDNCWWRVITLVIIWSRSYDTESIDCHILSISTSRFTLVSYTLLNLRWRDSILTSQALEQFFHSCQL